MHKMDAFTIIAPLILVAWIVGENQAAGRSEVDSPCGRWHSVNHGVQNGTRHIQLLVSVVPETVSLDIKMAWVRDASSSASTWNTPLVRWQGVCGTRPHGLTHLQLAPRSLFVDSPYRIIVTASVGRCVILPDWRAESNELRRFQRVIEKQYSVLRATTIYVRRPCDYWLSAATVQCDPRPFVILTHAHT
jgi:hypothetical protein